jgi:hypothetical protein
MDCVSPLDKGAAIACEARLAMSVDKLTELAIITLTEHQSAVGNDKQLSRTLNG